METIPREKIVEKAKEVVAPITNEDNTLRKKLAGNFAIVTTLVTISAYVILYAFKVGYYSIYHIPAECVRVDIRDYLPALVQLAGVSINIIWYVLLVKVDIVFHRARFHWMRVLYSSLILYILAYSNGILNRMKSIWLFLIVVSIAVIIELFVFLAFRFKGFKDVKKEDEKRAIENAASDLLLYNTVIRNGIFLIIIAVILASISGKVIAKNASTFQTFLKDDKEYAVIVDYGEKIIAQEAYIENGFIDINIDQYYFFTKDGLAFEYKEYVDSSLVSSLE